MGNVYESIISGLKEAIEDAKSGEKKLNRNIVHIEPIKEYSAEEVKRIRLNTGMSQNVFASYMGVSCKTVEAWEAGKNHPSGAASRLLNMMEIDNNLVDKFPFVKRM